jgi:hypothetical protein
MEARMAKKKSTKKSGTRKQSAKRELVEPRGGKRYVRRSARGRFTESDEVETSLSRDRRTKAKKTVKSGHGDKGDQARRTARR